MRETDEFKALQARHDVVLVDFAQCMYMLRPPDYNGTSDLRTMKRTFLLTNITELQQLQCTCDQQHIHVWALGTYKRGGVNIKRAKFAGTYPKELCVKWANLVAHHFRLDGKATGPQGPAADQGRC